mmetsp:Transcript_24068/g.60937  ORF Transcript_24068/g.60937 Transcript_24068/m.60937 type:complete len:208 (-) Transcript_24068:670-1293(-)
MAPALSKDSMAAPMAVSSWNTLAEEESEGSTVLSFLIMGRGTTPSLRSSTSWSLSSLIQRLLVLKKACLATSWKAFSSLSAHCADSRSSMCLSLVRMARWPPFLSASVLSATSMTNDLSDSAKNESRLRSRVAPRLSELDTNMYLMPASRSFFSTPDPAREGYRSPCPGGHHSLTGAAGYFAGFRVAWSILGTLFCTTSQSPAVSSP